MKHARPDYNRIQDPEGKIGQDEPVFLLRAQDIYAASVVAHWADLVERGNGDPVLVKMARDHAARMRAWSHRKKPDLPPEPQF